MAILRGDEARAWLAANPDKAFTDMTTGQRYGSPQQTQSQKPSGILGLILGLTQPFRHGVGIMGEFGGTISDLVKIAQGKDSEVGEDIFRKAGSIYLTEQEKQQLEEDPLQMGVKSGVGVASYGVPMGAAKGVSGLKAVGQAGLKGAGAGALGGFALSESGKELESTLKGAGLGALMGGALQGAGEAAKAIKSTKISNKLSEMSDDLKTTAYKKKIGVAPTSKQGKYDLVRASQKLADSEGVKITGPEDLYQFSEDLFRKYGSSADDMARAFDDMGGAISVDTIKKPLLEKLASVKTPELKAPYERVLDSIDSAVGGSKVISAKDLLQLRREWGNLGNWNQLTPSAEQSLAKVWEEVYKRANNTLEESFAKAGMEGFRDVNQKLATAIEQQNWARRAMATRTGQQVWTDLAQDATMFGTALGGGPGSLAGFAASKGLQRYGEDIASKGLDIASKVATGTSALPKVLQPMVSAGQRAIPALPALQQMGGGQQLPAQQMQQPVQNQEVNAINMLLVQGILSGEISAAEAEAVLSLLGMQGVGGKAPTANESKAQALQSSLDKLRSTWEGSGGGTRLMETLGINIGTGARALDQAKASVAEDLGRLQSQGVISPTEREEFDRMMPNSWDSPEIVEQKFAAIQDRINAY